MPSTKMFKFQHDDVITYDLSGDFIILFSMCIILVVNYPCAKFPEIATINKGDTCIFHVF